MSTSLVIWDLNITDHYPEILLQVSCKQETKIDGTGHEIFSENITGPWNILVYGLLGYENVFEKSVKPSASPPPSYILNVRSLITELISTNIWPKEHRVFACLLT